MVHSRFVRDWDHYLACTLKFIVVIVDGRGTGFKGRKLRNPVRGNLGEMEVRDQIEAARLVLAHYPCSLPVHVYLIETLAGSGPVNVMSTPSG